MLNNLNLSILNWYDDKFEPFQPWDTARASIYGFLANANNNKIFKPHIEQQDHKTFMLPDEDFFNFTVLGNGFLTLPPAFSEAAHAGEQIERDQENNTEKLFEELYSHINTALRAPTDTNLTQLYDIISKHCPMVLYLNISEAITTWSDEDITALLNMARWLAKNAPDREAVKFALTIMALCYDSADDILFYVFKTSEHFSPYCLYRLLNTIDESGSIDDQLIEKVTELYQRCEGFGRVFILDTIAPTEDDDPFEQLRERLFLIGPALFLGQQQSALNFFEYINMAKMMRMPETRAAALQSTLLCIESIMYKTEPADTQIYDIEGILPLIKNCIEHADNIPLNITHIYALEQIRRYLDDVVHDGDYGRRLAMIGWKRKTLESTYEQLNTFRTKHLADMIEITKEFADTPNGTYFHDMIKTLLSAFNMLPEGDNNDYCAWYEELFENGIRSPLASHFSHIQNANDFADVLARCAKQYLENHKWSNEGGLITQKDRDVSDLLMCCLPLFLYEYKLTKTELGQKFICHALQSPNKELRLEYLNALEAEIKRYQSDEIRSALEHIVLTDPDEDTRVFAQSLVKRKFIRFFSRR